MPDVIVASTTDTQTEIDRAAGVETEEVKPVSAEGSEEPETPADSEAASRENEPEKGHKDTNLAKRMKKFTKAFYESQEEIKTLREQVAELKSGKTPEAKAETVPVEPAQKPKPKMDDFPSIEEWAEAVADWKIDQKLSALKAETEEEEKADKAQKTADTIKETYNERVKEAEKNYDDWDDVVGGSQLELPNVIANEIMQLENGPDIVYYLASHRKEALEMIQSGPAASLVKLGKLADKLAVQPEVEEESPEHRSPNKRPVSAAPAPINPIRGSATKSTVPIDELPYSEYRRIRDQQEKARFRR